MAFPTSLDTFTNPSGASDLDTPAVLHSAQHANANDAIEALEAKVGVDGSAVTSSLDYKLTNPSSSDPGHVHTLYLPKSLGTTKGDALVFNGTAWVRVGVGSDNQVLTADSAQSAGVKWATPAGAAVTTKGDLLGFSTLPARVPVGSNGQVLVADSTQALGLKWAAAAGSVASDTIFDAKGDLAVGTGADTAARLAVGSNGQVLTADSTQTTGLKWAAASGSSAPKAPDDFPASAGSIDYEFEAETSSLPSGWSWVNQGSATYAETAGAGVISYGGAGSADWKMITRAVPAGSTWTVAAKLSGISLVGAAYTPNLILRESSSGKFVAFDRYLSTMVWYLEKWTNATTFAGSTFGGPYDPGGRPGVWYVRVKKNSATSFDWALSFDGVAWYTVTAALDMSAFFTPDEIGFGLNGQHSTAITASCHWFRQTA